MKLFFAFLAISLLGANLVYLVKIEGHLAKKPLTYADLKANGGNPQQTVLEQAPVVFVSGGNIGVDVGKYGMPVIISTPLSVRVVNDLSSAPIPVTMRR